MWYSAPRFTTTSRQILRSFCCITAKLMQCHCLNLECCPVCLCIGFYTMHSTWTELLPHSSSCTPLHTGQTALFDLCEAVCLEPLVVFCFCTLQPVVSSPFSICSLIFCAFLSSRILTISSSESCCSSGCLLWLLLFWTL